MRALRFHAARDLRLEEVATPPRPTGDQVLVAPVKAGICGTDVHEYAEGPLRTVVKPHPVTGGHVPQILGHEFAGTIVDVGPDVRSLTPGQRVSVMPLRAAASARCAAPDASTCDLRAAVGLRHPWGGMAELALVQERQASPMPDSLTWEQGAMIEPAAVSWAAAQAAGEVAPGQSVLVTGFGPIGALAAFAAVAAGGEARRRAEFRARRARRRAGLRRRRPALWPSPRRRPATRFADGVDVAIECAGVEAAIQGALASLRPGGVVVQTGVPATPPTLDLRSLMLRGLSIVAVLVGYPLSCWPTVMDEVASSAATRCSGSCRPPFRSTTASPTSSNGCWTPPAARSSS